MDEWNPCRLGELVSIKHGWPFKSKLCRFELQGGPIVVNTGNFRYDGGFRFDETALREYCGEFPPEFILVPGDILLVMTCQTPGGEILGIPGRIPADGRTYLHNQRLGKVIIRNPDAIDANFAYWLCLWSKFNRHLVTTASGSKILHTAPSRIEDFCFRLPSLREQKVIGACLQSLQSKIELNRHTNETLEALARAIFKDWFVDFGPTRAKAEGRAPYLEPALWDLFPDRLDAEGKPEGWELGDLSDCIQLQRGFDLPAKQRRPGKYEVIAAGGPHGTHDEYRVRGPGVVTGRSGVIGNVFLTLDDFWPLNTTLWVKEFRRSSPAHAYFLLGSIDLVGYGSGSAVPTLNRNHVHMEPVVLPPLALLQAYSEQADLMFSRIQQGLDHNSDQNPVVH